MTAFQLPTQANGTQKLSRHRRILYTGLRGLMDDQQALSALSLWQDKYAHQAQFPLRYFAEDVAKQMDHKITSRRILLSLADILAKKTDKGLLPDPERELYAFRKNHASTADITRFIPEVEAFKMLIQKCLTLVDEKSATKHHTLSIRRYVIGQIESLEVDSYLKVQVSGWLDNLRSTICVADVRVEDLRKVFNLFYIAMCEYIGPVQADALIAQSVSRLRSNGGGKYADTFTRLL